MPKPPAATEDAQRCLASLSLVKKAKYKPDVYGHMWIRETEHVRICEADYICNVEDESENYDGKEAIEIKALIMMVFGRMRKGSGRTRY